MAKKKLFLAKPACRHRFVVLCRGLVEPMLTELVKTTT